MTVFELISLLEEFDPDAEVKIMSQRNWPFENRIFGIASRRDINQAIDDAEIESTDEDADASDVFIVQGDQLRYGSERAWDLALQ